MANGYDDQTLIRYRFAEYEKGMERDGGRCWMCGRPLTTPASGRAHRIADNKMNRKKYGSWVLDHHFNFYMSCADHNSYATKYKLDPDGDIRFRVVVATDSAGNMSHGESANLSILTEQDKLDLISSIESDLLERKIDKRRPEKPEKVHNDSIRSLEGRECNKRVTALRYELKKESPDIEILNKKYRAYQKASDVLLANIKSSNRKYTALKTRKKYDKLYDDKIKELLSETEN